MKTLVSMALLFSTSCAPCDEAPPPDAGAELDAGRWPIGLVVCRPAPAECWCSLEAIAFDCTFEMVQICARLEEMTCWVCFDDCDEPPRS